MSSQQTSSTRCSRNSHSPTATTAPTPVNPPNGAPSRSGSDRKITKPWRKPDRQAAVNSAPTSRAGQRTRPPATTFQPHTSGTVSTASTE